MGELQLAHGTWHKASALLQARSQMMDEVSSAVDDAMTDATPLGRDQGLLESTAQSFVDGEESSLRQSETREESVRYPNSMQVSSHATHQDICALVAAFSRGRDVTEYVGLALKQGTAYEPHWGCTLSCYTFGIRQYADAS